MTGLVLDTCFISELSRPKPNEDVLRWFESHFSQTFLTPILLMEVEFGILLQRDQATAEKLRRGSERLFSRFPQERRLIFDNAAANWTASMLADARQSGRPLQIADGQILGIAGAMGYAVATRDADFLDRGVEVVNPWDFN